MQAVRPHHARYRYSLTLDRLLALALRLGTGLEVSTAYIREVYGVSHATAKRDLTRLECALPVTVEGEGVEAKVLRPMRRAA